VFVRQIWTSNVPLTVEAMAKNQHVRIVLREWRLNTQKQSCGPAARETHVLDREVCVSALTGTTSTLAYLPLWA
jgi:hypothetical protein